MDVPGARQGRSESNRLARRQRILFVVCLAIVGLASLTLSPGVSHASRWALSGIPGTGRVNTHLNPFRTKHALLDSGLPVYDLHIKPSEYRKVREVVKKAKVRGLLTDDLKIWSKASLIHQGVTRKAKVRVRGDLRNHWEGKRKSWRVKLNRESPLNGVREFNLILLSDSKGIEERFTNVLFHKLGMITLRDSHVILRINGVMQGIYYQVEHLAPAVLAHHRRQEGPVFCNPKNGLDLASFKSQVADAGSSAWAALQTLLDYETNPTAKNFQRATSVTDMEDYLKFVAGTTLFCSDHSGFVTDNHKVYFDSSRGLFYRIPWDIRPLHLPGVFSFQLEDIRATFDVFRFQPMPKMRVGVLTDPAYRLRRDRILWDLVKDNSLLKEFDDTYRELDLALWTDVMADGNEAGRLAEFRTLLETNRSWIRRSLKTNQAEVRFRREGDNVASLQMAVNCAAGMVMQAVHLEDAAASASGARTYELYRDNNADGKLDATDTLIAKAKADQNGRTSLVGLHEVMLPAARAVEDHPTHFYRKSVRTAIFLDTKRFQYLLTWKNAGDENVGDPTLPSVQFQISNAVTGQPFVGDEVRTQMVHPPRSFEPLRRTAGLDAFLADNHQFTRTTEADGSTTVSLSAGVHRFSRTVVIPNGIRLRVEPGATLRLDEGVSMICHGAVDAIGTNEAPIRVLPAQNGVWGTWGIVRAAGRSTLRHVEIRGGGGATVDGIEFTGALAFHDGDVSLESCRVTECQSDDGLNVKNGNVSIANSYFSGNRSDAIDLDFVEGEITRCHFEDNAGDAIDLSGSRVTINDCRIANAGDKGISVGEDSRATITGTLVRNCVMGIAVKDLSRAVVSHCTLVGNKTALAAYRKKPIFGGGELRVTESVLGQSEKETYQDAYSVIHLENCLGSPSTGPWDSSIATQEWFRQLGSQDFVLNDSLIDAAGAGSANQNRPGIVSAPVVLR